MARVMVAQTRAEILVVLRRSMTMGEHVAVSVALAVGQLRAAGLVRALDDRTVEITAGERVRRVPLSRVVEARAVPARRPVEMKPASGAEDS
jgi:hypothetical protein